MHVIVPRTALLSILESVIGSSDKKGGVPALAHVLLAASGSGETSTLRATCTDFYQSTIGGMTGEVVEAGSVSVDVKALLARVKAMPVGNVEILATDGGTVTVKANGAPRRFQMHGLPGGEFPAPPEPPPIATWIDLPASLLARLIDATSYAQATDETRPNIHATFLEWEGKILRAVTTDGHRLAKAEVQVETEHRFAMLVGADAIMQIRRLVEHEVAKNKAGPVRLTTAGPHVFLDVDSLHFSAKIVDAQFPPYQHVLAAASSSATHALRAPRDRLIESLKATTIAADNGILAMKALASTLRIGNVSAAQAAKGESADELEVSYSGPGVRIGLNSAYVVEALEALPEGEAVVKLGGELDAIVVEPATPEEGVRLLAVVMPARIEAEVVAVPSGVKVAG